MAYSIYYIGNVYNAWNKEPQTTLRYYQQAFELFNSLPDMQVKAYQLRYIIAHALDGEKLGDTLRCIQTIETALHDLQTLPDTVRQKMIYLSDFAWVATNSGAYALAEKVLKMVPRGGIINDRQTNNYLDHYFLTRSRIDVYQHGLSNSPYLDSLALALRDCTNRFDSGYYSFNLSELYSTVGNISKAYKYLKVNSDLQKGLDNSTVLSTLQRELLNRELQTEREKDRRTKEELKNKNLFLIIMGLALLTLGLMVFLYLLYRRRVEERKEGARQQRFTHLLLEKVELERKRIATDLHDGINHELLNLKNNLHLQNAIATTDVANIITSVREISRNLYPALFETVGLAASVEGLCERMQKAGFFATCDIEYLPKLTKEQELQVYRLIQEALTNVAKHAEAEACKITIKTTSEQFWVEIKDNGKGFDQGKIKGDKTTFGLQSMQQRAKAVDAKLSIQSTKFGTIITLTKLL